MHQRVNDEFYNEKKACFLLREQATTSFHAIAMHHSHTKLFHKHQPFGQINKQMNDTATTHTDAICKLHAKKQLSQFIHCYGPENWVPKPDSEEEVYSRHILPGSGI